MDVNLRGAAESPRLSSPTSTTTPKASARVDRLRQRRHDHLRLRPADLPPDPSRKPCAARTARCKTCTTPTIRLAISPTSSDDAQQTIFFRNQRVEPSADYTYDAIYRLIEATGREHLGQVGGSRRLAFSRRCVRVWACRIRATASDGHATRALRVRRGRQFPGCTSRQRSGHLAGRAITPTRKPA